MVGERVFSVWTFNWQGQSTLPPVHTTGYQSDGSRSEDWIQGTFRVIEVERRFYPGTAMQYSRMEYRVEGSATGTSSDMSGAWRQVQQGFYWTEITECPAVTHTQTASYTLTGSARNGFVTVTGATGDFAGRDDIETLEVGTCTVDHWDQVTDERASATRPNKIIVGNIKGFDRTYSADENWEHSYTSDDGGISQKDWISAIETMPCILEPNQNPVLVYSEHGGHSYAKLPDGSDYQWSITSGGDKARIEQVYANGQTVEVEVIAQSESPNDIVVTGIYAGEDGVRHTCSAFITGLAPSRLQLLEHEDLALRQQDDRWSLGVRRKYQVLDQFGTPLREEGLEVGERLTSVDAMGNPATWDRGARDLSFNPNDVTLVGPGAPSVAFEAQSWYTDGEGTFDDTVYIWRVGLQFPESTNLLIYQDVLVDGRLVGQFVLHFLSNSVAVAVQ